MKFVVQVLLPALATLYLVLAQQWDLPDPEKVVASITAVTVFLGIFLVKSNSTFKNSLDRFAGDLTYTVDTSGKTVYSLELSGQPEDLLLNDEAVFKVTPGIEA
jgi:hypothetical protein